MSDLMHASISRASLDAVRRHLADAPDWARAAIDSERAKRGMPTLFKGSVPPAGVKARRLRPARTLVGVAAPAVSQPHHLDGFGTAGRELLPEIISERAWLGVQADLLMGETFDFRCGHAGKPWVRSDDPEVEITWA